MGKAELISQAEYARRRGVDPTSVRDAIRAGRITLIEGKIDPSVADVQWQTNTRRRARAVDETPAAHPVLGEGGYAYTGAVPDYNESRARREAAEAEKAELELAQLRGQLVSVDEVRASLQRRIAGVREALLQLPARVVPLLVANPDAASMDRLLREELTAAMQQIADT